jgi:hypothetical protein
MLILNYCHQIKIHVNTHTRMHFSQIERLHLKMPQFNV